MTHPTRRETNGFLPRIPACHKLHPSSL
jgi:hypothetical protein